MRIKWTVLACTPGQTEDIIKENIKWIKNKEKVITSGQMEEYTEEPGKMENRMVTVT